MAEGEPDVETDLVAVLDRGEPLSEMEPLVLGAGAPRRADLTDKALELAARSAGFRRSLPPGVAAALAGLVRSMNCYYSNLIEGHNTHPIDIERALSADYSADPAKRNLQREARAHQEQPRACAHGVPGKAGGPLDARSVSGSDIDIGPPRFKGGVPASGTDDLARRRRRVCEDKEVPAGGSFVPISRVQI